MLYMACFFCVFFCNLAEPTFPPVVVSPCIAQIKTIKLHKTVHPSNLVRLRLLGSPTSPDSKRDRSWSRNTRRSSKGRRLTWAPHARRKLNEAKRTTELTRPKERHLHGLGFGMFWEKTRHRSVDSEWYNLTIPKFDGLHVPYLRTSWGLCKGSLRPRCNKLGVSLALANRKKSIL